MKLGFHISIAGGFKNVVPRARALGCETIQFFSRNPRGWQYKLLDAEDCALFKAAIKKEKIAPVFVHMPYLPNLASNNTELFHRSVEALIEDLERSEMLAAPYVIMHVGSAEDESGGIARMIAGINAALNKVKNPTILLLENTAGSGNELGYTFEQLQAIVKGVSSKERIGIVLDIAHAFEAGYDLASQQGIERTVREFDTIIGLKKLRLIHLNDSKTAYGSRSDRHWHIGKGKIGKSMRHILNHPQLRHLPFIMETPRTDTKEDLMNMKATRALLDT